MRNVLLLMLLCVFCLFGFGLAGASSAGDAAKGETLAKGCRCHKSDLNGKPAAELVEKLEGYKSGALENRVMNKKAANLSEQDMADLAAYFSAK